MREVLIQKGPWRRSPGGVALQRDRDSQQTVRRSGEGVFQAGQRARAMNSARPLTKGPYTICILKRCYKYIYRSSQTCGRSFSPFRLTQVGTCPGSFYVAGLSNGNLSKAEGPTVTTSGKQTGSLSAPPQKTHRP